MSASIQRHAFGTAAETVERLRRPLFDAIDRQLLEELGEDGRLTMAELGRRVSLSAPAVTERVQRLEQAGVIVGYRAVVDPKAIGYPIAAVVRVRPASRQLHRIPEVARETPEVVECYRITGEDCFFLKLHLRSIDDLEEILDRFVVYGQTTTSIVQFGADRGPPATRRARAGLSGEPRRRATAPAGSGSGRARLPARPSVRLSRAPHGPGAPGAANRARLPRPSTRRRRASGRR